MNAAVGRADSRPRVSAMRQSTVSASTRRRIGNKECDMEFSADQESAESQLHFKQEAPVLCRQTYDATAPTQPVKTLLSQVPFLQSSN